MTRKSNQELLEDYLRWLEPQLQDEYGRPDKTYSDLLNVMAEQEFAYIVPMDDNRIADGLYLRVEFANEFHVAQRRMEQLGPCSFLEVLIALSRRLAFIAGGQAPGWAWQLLGNLELQRMSDPLSRAKRNKVQEIMNNVIQRKYSPDGTGGFFPLAWSDDDQTQIELWYQMNTYVEELHPEH